MCGYKHTHAHARAHTHTHTNIYIYIWILFWILKSHIHIPEDGHYNRNMYNVLTRLIKLVLVDCSTYINYKMIYHDGINITIIFTKIKLIKFSGIQSSLWSNYSLLLGFCIVFHVMYCLPSLVWLNLFKWMLKWYGGRNVSYIRWFEGVCSVTEGSKRGMDCQDPIGVSGLQGDIFLGFTSGICENNVVGS